jgi:hypothetical protein
MTETIDTILYEMSTAASFCYDLNGNGQLTREEQTVFYQFAEHVVLQLAEMNANYDVLSSTLTDEAAGNLIDVWVKANEDLEAFSRTFTNPKMRSAVSSTAYAIDCTSTVLQLIAV